MQAARDRQKSYADLKLKPMEFEVGDKVMHKPIRGRTSFDDKSSVCRGTIESTEVKLNGVEYEARIPLVKVRWNSKRGPEFTWEREDQFRKKYLHLFSKTGPSSNAAS
ncbi:hypothetical protein Tco_1235911 [Tanacetum coccineum]